MNKGREFRLIYFIFYFYSIFLHAFNEETEVIDATSKTAKKFIEINRTYADSSIFWKLFSNSLYDFKLKYGLSF